MHRLFIIGAGGHGKVIADIAMKCGYREIAFFDDNAKGECMGIPIKGKCGDTQQYADKESDFIIAIGNNKIRRMLADKLQLNWVTLIHPSAQIGINVKLGAGTVVMANAVINPSASVGSHCIVNTAAIVEHDNVLEDFVHISPNAALGGTVHIGQQTHIGIGATVKNNVTITSCCTIGAGAVVTKDITETGIYTGIPARKKCIIKNSSRKAP